ncbi:hypothetical protein FLP15_05590 [Lactococcus protaetiae]|uniref:WxL domain-containing protein n=1 Tax=Lactococcus protaetiae TaxID=2592653 RepID=A0A514Z7Z7_9LACT|nr:hypothetical protein FLP15_05590 [Lactococcus protaetiae]
MNLSYSGTLSLEVPELISFGSHEISGNTIAAQGIMDSDVLVHDGRGTPRSWRMEVQQSAPLTAYDTTTGLVIHSFGLDGALHFVDSAGNDTALTGTASPTVFNQTVGTDHLVSVLEASSIGGAGLYLEVLPEQQIATWQGKGIVYKGALNWIISDAP